MAARSGSAGNKAPDSMGRRNSKSSGTARDMSKRQSTNLKPSWDEKPGATDQSPGRYVNPSRKNNAPGGPLKPLSGGSPKPSSEQLPRIAGASANNGTSVSGAGSPGPKPPSPRVTPLALSPLAATTSSGALSPSPLGSGPTPPVSNRQHSPRLPGLESKSSHRRSVSNGSLGAGAPPGAPSPLATPSTQALSEPLIPWNTLTSVPSASPENDNFEDLDGKIVDSPTFRELYRIVRMCSAQASCYAMVRTLEQQVAHLLHADVVQLWLVKRDHFRREGRNCPLGEGIAGYVQRTKEIVNLQAPTKNSRWRATIDGVAESGPNSAVVPSALLCLPVEADHRSDCSGSKDVVAVFQAYKLRDGERFTNRDCKVLYRLGEFAGNMLRNSSKLDQAQALYNASLTSHQRSAALLEVAKTLASETKLGSVVQIIVKKVPELLDADRCTLFLVDMEHRQLVVNKGASQGRPKNLVSWIFGQSNSPDLPFEEGKNSVRLPIEKGIAGYVALNGDIVNIEDAHLDSRFDATMDMKTGYRTRSILCVPMIDADLKIIGVVQVLNKNPLYRGFDREDEVLLKTFSAQAALAVRNSQLFEQTQSALRQSDALLEVTNALSQELKIGALIKIIVAKVQNLLDSERCTVYIVDKEKKEMYTSDAMSFGMGPALPIDTSKAKMIHFPLDRGIAGSTATTGNTINIPDAYQDDRFNKAMDIKTGYRTRSILCMAIKNHHREVIGVLQVMNKRSSTFGEEDEKLLAAFSSQAAVAIENSKLFQQTEKALNHALADQRNLKFLLSVTKNLFSDMHLTSMIDQMTMQVHHLLKADDCALYLVDDKTREFYLAKDVSDIGCKRYQFSKGIAGVVAASGQTIRISTAAHKDPRFDPEVDQRKDKTTHSILCCPIKAEINENETQIIGVISVRDEKDRGGFEQEEEKLLKVFSAQAAVAIMNSRRFSAIMEQSEIKDRDHSAADYLKEKRGMKLASDDIDNFNYRMEDIQLKGAIGTGSYGEVYRAVVRGQVVAVKKLHVRNLKAEQVDAFCKEASLMCQLDQANIVSFIGAVTEPSNLCIITQYCARGSLADLLLDDSIPMDFSRKLKFGIHAARGMLYLHSSNPVILHRDLKSDNLLVTQDWTVKVADFGLTRFLSEKKAMTQVGTPMWMAPEIIMGRKYTEKADVYAFGIILWEILTRQEPYEDKEPMQIVVEVVNDDLRPTIPGQYRDNPLVPLMKDCWATDPNQRPSFKVILERLESVASQVPGALTEDERRDYVERQTSREREGKLAAQLSAAAGAALRPAEEPKLGRGKVSADVAAVIAREPSVRS